MKDPDENAPHGPRDSADLNRAVEVILRELDMRWGVEAAWLFGSQLRGARPDSDIDVAGRTVDEWVCGHRN
ncbi:MAG: nucleotidyltransferase domain-containing protein [Pseudomonadota bacterium]